jgi:hypothetical protein
MKANRKRRSVHSGPDTRGQSYSRQASREHSTGTEVSIRSGDVFDDDGLSKRASYPLGKESPDCIKGATRWQRHDHGDWPRRIGLRLGSPRYGWKRGSARGQMQKLKTGKFHDVPSQNAAANAGARGSGDNDAISLFRFENRARRRHQAAIFRKRRPRNVAVFGQLSVEVIRSAVSKSTTFRAVTLIEFARSQTFFFSAGDGLAFSDSRPESCCRAATRRRRCRVLLPRRPVTRPGRARSTASAAGGPRSRRRCSRPRMTWE